MGSWKVRSVVIALIAILVTLAGSIIIPRVVPMEYQFAAGLTCTVAVLFAFVFVFLDLYSGIRRDDREELASSAAEKAIESVMTYKFDPQKGGFYYGDVRNVLTRVKTAQIIVEGLYKTRRKDPEVLHKIGHQVGASFASDLAAEVLPSKDIDHHRLSKDLLDLWHEYDYRAGFADFNFKDFDVDSCEGVIQNTNHFLLFKRWSEAPILCPFFEGYVEAVLSHFSGKNVVVTSECLKHSSHQVCKLKVTDKSSPYLGKETSPRT